MRISNLILFDYPRDPKGHGTAASRRWSPAVQLFYKTLLRRCRCLAHNFCPRRSPFSWQQYQLSLLSLWFSQIASSQIFPVWFPKSTTLYSYIYISYMYIVHLFKKKTTNMCTKPGVSITTKGTSRRFCQSGLNTVLLVPRHRFLFTVDIPMNQWYWYWKNMMEIPSGKLT